MAPECRVVHALRRLHTPIPLVGQPLSLSMSITRKRVLSTPLRIPTRVINPRRVVRVLEYEMNYWALITYRQNCVCLESI